MSDPLTNVEIEDVLSSIRRLVSDGEKARPRSDTSDETAQDSVDATDESDKAEEVTQKTDKLVLTPALMVVEGTNAPVQDAPDHNPSAQEPEKPQPSAQGDVSGIDRPAAPLPLTDAVWEDGADPVKMAKTDAPEQVAPKPNRSELAATIAELEAEISGRSDDYDQDDTDDMVPTMDWPADPQAPAQTATEAAADTLAAGAAADAVADVYADDDIDTLTEQDALSIDSDMLREMVCDVVREELTGPMGERITRNVRKLVRREIYRVLASKDFD